MVFLMACFECMPGNLHPSISLWLTAAFYLLTVAAVLLITRRIPIHFFAVQEKAGDSLGELISTSYISSLLHSLSLSHLIQAPASFVLGSNYIDQIKMKFKAKTKIMTQLLRSQDHSYFSVFNLGLKCQQSQSAVCPQSVRPTILL